MFRFDAGRGMDTVSSNPELPLGFREHITFFFHRAVFVMAVRVSSLQFILQTGVLAARPSRSRRLLPLDAFPLVWALACNDGLERSTDGHDHDCN